MLDDATARRLFDELVVDPTTTKLAMLRARTGLNVRSVAVNGQRVDVRVGDADDEWHVVFHVVDRRVDWFDVFRRPLPFEGVSGGRAIVVNGPSSSGKSTLLAELGTRSQLPWVVFDEPHLGMVRHEHLIWRDGRDVLHRGFLDAIAALAARGNYVALSAGGHPQAAVDAAFAGVATIRVGLHCSIDELTRREATRRDIIGGLAASSVGVHDGWQYDLEFDTSTVGVDAMVEALLTAVSAAGASRTSDGRTARR